MVLEFILERLRFLGLVPCAKPLRLMQLSKIQHLWTPIQADLPPDLHILQILEQLHPTPAVAGVPRDMALKNIRQYEPEERCLYAAPLGWVDRGGNGEFIVGIRSALIEGDRARLYGCWHCSRFQTRTRTSRSTTETSSFIKGFGLSFGICLLLSFREDSTSK